jgi:hypothetical protein
LYSNNDDPPKSKPPGETLQPANQMPSSNDSTEELSFINFSSIQNAAAALLEIQQRDFQQM